MSETREKLGALYELQLIDNELIASLQEVRRIESQESPVQKKYAELQKKLGQLEESEKPILQEIQELKDNTEQLNEEKKETEDQLFGSAIGDHKTLQALQQKREQIVGMIKMNEDNVLKKQNDLDSIGIKKNELLEQIKEIQSEYDEVVKERERLKEEHTKNVEEQKKKRTKFKDFEDKELLSHYQNLQKQNNGVAIAPVEDGVCNGCFVEVSAATMQKLEYGDELVHCQRCGRMLYLNDDEKED